MDEPITNYPDMAEMIQGLFDDLAIFRRPLGNPHEEFDRIGYCGRPLRSHQCPHHIHLSLRSAPKLRRRSRLVDVFCNKPARVTVHHEQEIALGHGVGVEKLS